MIYAILFILAFLKSIKTDLCIIASIIPATVNTPPNIAQTLIKNDKDDILTCLYSTVIGERSYLKNNTGNLSKEFSAKELTVYWYLLYDTPL